MLAENRVADNPRFAELLCKYNQNKFTKTFHNVAWTLVENQEITIFLNVTYNFMVYILYTHWVGQKGFKLQVVGSNFGIGFIFYFLYCPAGKKKVPKPQVLRSNPSVGHIFLHFVPKMYANNVTIIDEKSWDLIKSTEPRDSGFESHHELCFLKFFLIKKQYLSILSHTDVAYSGHSWFVLSL